MGWAVNTTSQPIYPLERPGTHCIGDWVGPRAGLDGRGKSNLHQISMILLSQRNFCKSG
jgi:hypothetical protein